MRTKTPRQASEELVDYDDTPRRDGADRYALYIVSHKNLQRRRLCTTSRDGIGLALLTMLGLSPDGEPAADCPAEIERGDSVGLFDREKRSWLVNPYLQVR